jgi:CubicO group peptidase (beta-lactamase class C family)
MVERANNGTRLGEYMQTNIWDRLGMSSTTFRLASRPDISDRRPDMTLRLGDGTLIKSPTKFFSENAVDDCGGGGCYSTAADYIKVLISLLANDEVLLKKASVDLLFQPQLQNRGQAFKEALYSASVGGPGGEADLGLTGGLPRVADVSYGLGGLVTQADIPGGRKSGSMAWGGLPNLQWVIDREAGHCYMYASQLLPPGDLKSTEIFREFEKAIYRKGEVSKL